MKNRIIILVAAMTAWLTAGAQYKITGDIKGLTADKVYIDINSMNNDSAVVSGGKFVLQQSAPFNDVTYVTLHSSDNKWGYRFWMGDDQIALSGEVGAPPTLTGSKTEDEYQAYRRHMQPMWDEESKVVAEGKRDPTKMDSLQNYFYNVMKPQEDSIFMEFLKKYPSSYVSLNHIYNCRLMNKYAYGRYMKMMNMLTPGAFKGYQWNMMKKTMEQDKGFEPGSVFPEMSINDVYGEAFDIKSLRGKYVMLVIANGTQKEYVSDLELRKRLYAKYHDKGLEMVDMMMGRSLSEAVKPAANHNLPWKFVSDFKGFYSPFIKANGIDHLEQNFIIGRDGVIIRHNVYGGDLESAITDIFK